MVSRRYRPQLATLVATPPSGPEWIHEVKFDGYRIGALREGGVVRLESRNSIDWTSRLPEVADAVRLLPCKSAVIDGEVAIMKEDGRTSFQSLQRVFRAGATREGLVYQAFDLLELDGRLLEGLPLIARKVLLEQLVEGGAPLIQYSKHLEADGPAVFRKVCEMGLEGMVSKLKSGRHRAGRSNGWLKTKCTKVRPFVIGAFTEPSGSRSGIGGLLLGVYEDGALIFCGGVGTGQGWTADVLTEMRRGLSTIEQESCPFAQRPPAEYLRGVHWVRPVLVCEVSFIEWTEDGTLRHPSFQRFLPDVKAPDVSFLHG